MKKSFFVLFLLLFGVLFTHSQEVGSTSSSDIRKQEKSEFREVKKEIRKKEKAEKKRTMAEEKAKAEEKLRKEISKKEKDIKKAEKQTKGLKFNLDKKLEKGKLSPNDVEKLNQKINKLTKKLLKDKEKLDRLKNK